MSNTSKKNPKKAALGRGLGSLLGENTEAAKPAETKQVLAKAPTAFTEQKDQSLKEGFVDEAKSSTQKVSSPPQGQKVPESMRVWNVRIDRIHPNESQPRKTFDADGLEELSSSIKEQGILQPITVRKLKEEGHFEIIAGERRWRAAQKAGLQEVPILLKDVGDQKSLELALIENIQRRDLNPVEEAEAYYELIKSYQLTQQQLSEKVGKPRVTIANTLRLLNLSASVRELLVNGELSMGQAKVLLTVADPMQQKTIAQRAVKEGLTVRELEKLIEKSRSDEAVTETSADVLDVDVSNRLMKGLSEELQKLLGTRVQINYKKGKGKIGIHFYSDDELNTVVDKLREAWQK